MGVVPHYRDYAVGPDRKSIGPEVIPQFSRRFPMQKIITSSIWRRIRRGIAG